MTSFAELDLVARTERLEAAVAEIRKIGDEGERTEGRVSTSMSRMASSVARFIVPLAGAMIGAFAGRGMINALDTYENRMLRVQAIIDATGGVAGRSARQLEQQAQGLARASLESVDGIMRAQQTLLTFRNVQGEVFDRAIEGALDLAAAMGGDLNSATMQLARALEDPVRGMTALTRSGTVFTDEQREMVKAMVEAGDMMGAQTFILSELEAQYGGAAGAVTPLASALDSLGQSNTNLAIAIGQALGAGDRLAAMVTSIDNGVQFLTNNLDLAAGGVAALGVAIAIGYAPAVWGAVAATWAWVGGLAALRVALIKTGVGALVVGLGVGIAYLIRIREATGSWGEALALVGDIVREVVERIVMRLEALDQKIYAVAADARAGFLGMAAGVVDGVQSAVDAVDAGVTSLVNVSIQGIAGLINVAIDGLNKVIELANKIPGVDVGTIGQFAPTEVGSVLGGTSGALGGISESLREEQGLARQAAIDMRAYADILNELAGQPLQSVEALREGMAGLSDETVDYEDAVRRMNDAMLDPSGTGGGAGGGGAGEDAFQQRLEALQQGLMTEREVIDAWYEDAQEILADRRAQEILGEEEHREALLRVEEEYHRRLAELREQASVHEIAVRQQTVNAAIGLLQQLGQRSEALAKVAVAVNAAQRIMEIRANTAAAIMRAYAELGPIAGAAAASRIGALGAVQQAIAAASAALQIGGSGRGGSSGGASIGGSGGATSRREPAPAPSRQERIVRFDVQGDGMFAEMLRQNIEAISDALIDEQSMGGTTILVANS